MRLVLHVNSIIRHIKQRFSRLVKRLQLEQHCITICIVLADEK